MPVSVRPRAWAVAFSLRRPYAPRPLLVESSRNAFDDHYEPILMIMRTGVIPAKDACWECYHPPVFYWLSAMIGNFAVRMGVHPRHLLKLLQFIPCVYGILNMGMIYLILRKVPLSDFPRLAAFGTVCFLPRHIYMSAMHSNDTISYLCVSLCIYLLLIAIERTLSPASLVAVTVALTIALFTKYTAYAMLPVTLIAFAALFIGPRPSSRARVLGSCILVFLLPLAALGVSLAANARHYGRPMPINLDLRGVRLAQPRDANRFDFVSFTPWDSIATPMLVPGKMHSFWTMLYRGMWYDTEPKFLYFLDSNAGWWNHYYAWLRGEKDFPGDNPSMSSLTRCMGEPDHPRPPPSSAAWRRCVDLLPGRMEKVEQRAGGGRGEDERLPRAPADHCIRHHRARVEISVLQRSEGILRPRRGACIRCLPRFRPDAV